MGHGIALAEKVVCRIGAINITGIALQVNPVGCALWGVNWRAGNLLTALIAWRLMAGNAPYGLQGEKVMSDRWQYVVGGIISLVLALGYLTLTDEASSDGGHEARTSDQTQDPPSPDAVSGTELDILSPATPSSPVTPSVGAPLGSIDAALTPKAVSLPTEPALNDSLDPPAVSVLPATASGAVGQEAVVHDEANSE